MNWSAFFAGAPEGFQKGMDWQQKYSQQQKTNPLQVQQQQLQNQQAQQNLSQGNLIFNREGNAFDAMMRQYMPGQAGQPQGSQFQGGQPAGAYGQPYGGQPQGMTPTARPQGSGQPMPNMDNILAGPRAWGPQQQSGFSGTPQQYQGVYNQPPQNYGGQPGGMIAQPWNTYSGYMGGWGGGQQ